jgi:hypothetical protein
MAPCSVLRMRCAALSSSPRKASPLRRSQCRFASPPLPSRPVAVERFKARPVSERVVAKGCHCFSLLFTMALVRSGSKTAFTSLYFRDQAPGRMSPGRRIRSDIGNVMGAGLSAPPVTILAHVIELPAQEIRNLGCHSDPTGFRGRAARWTKHCKSASLKKRSGRDGGTTRPPLEANRLGGDRLP